MASDRRPLFDEVDRTDATPSSYQESTFGFLNRIAGPYWDHPRSLMQDWLDRIERDSDYTELRQRFRSGNDEQFRSAYLELYLHEVFVRAGFKVTIHPDIGSASTHPDFLLERGVERIYVEAIAPGSNPAAKAAAQRRAVLFDVVNKLNDPNFLLWLDELKEGVRPPASARLRAGLRQWLARLDPDEPWDIDSAPIHRWELDDWSAVFKAIPLKREARGNRPGGRAIGVFGHTEVDFIDDAPAIRKALATKHREYGVLDAPFIIAVGLYIHDRDRWHTTNALYGRLGFEFLESPDGAMSTREVRQPDGYFGMPPEWQHRNVSGVLIVNQLMPYHFQRAEVTLWRHPNPVNPLPEALDIPGDVVHLGGHKLTEIPPAVTPVEFFGLVSPWPPGEPWSAEESLDHR